MRWTWMCLSLLFCGSAWAQETVVYSKYKRAGKKWVSILQREDGRGKSLGSVSLDRVGWIARAIIPALVEGQKPRSPPFEVGAEGHLLIVHREVRETAAETALASPDA